MSHPLPTVTNMDTSLRLYGVKVALDPSPAQQRLLRSHAGAARFVFNQMLAEVKLNLTAREWEKRLLGGCLTEVQGWSLPALRRTWNANKDVWAPWWPEVSKEAFNHGLQALSDALGNWADSRSGKRKGPKVGFPRFRGRRARRTFSYTTGSFRPNRDGVSVQLPRVGRVHTHESVRGLVTKIEIGVVRVKRASVSFSQGRWWVAFTIEDHTVVATPVPLHEVVGVDVGVIDLLVAATPDGTEVLRVPAPRALKAAQAKLRWLQRRVARQQKFSGRWHKTQRRIAKVHAHAADLRRDTIHKATTQLVKVAGTVVVEDLNVAGMGARKPGAGAGGRGLNRAIADAALAEVHRQLVYKSGWHGREVVVADRWYPSSKLCSLCGMRKPSLPLDVRQYDCPQCGLSMDRDLNAAVNLAHLGVCTSCRQWAGDTKLGRGADWKTCTPSCVRAGGCETSTSRRQMSGQTRTAIPQEVAA